MLKLSFVTTVEHGQMKYYESQSTLKNCTVQLEGSGFWKRIIGSLRLEGTSRDGLVQAPCSKQGQLEQFSQCHVQSGLNTFKNGDSTTSSSNWFQHSITLGINFFLMFLWIFLYLILCLLPLYWAPLRFIWLCHLYSSLSDIYTHW